MAGINGDGKQDVIASNGAESSITSRCVAPLKAIQELLGHATIMMTMRYAHLAPEIARESVCLLDGLGDRGKTVAETAAN